LVPDAAAATLSDISPVAVFCCSTETAMAPVNSRISCIRSAMLPMARTALCVEVCTAAI